MLELLISNRWLIRLLGRLAVIPVLGRAINRFLTNRIASATVPRPRPFSLWSAEPLPDPGDPGQAGPITDYSSWPSLTDRRFSGRHLPPASKEAIAALPADPHPQKPGEPWGPVTSLFERQGAMSTDRSSVLFMFFAQWFTDSVLRVDPTDRRRNTSNHNVDLCQIYGLKESEARLLRSEHGGKLRSRWLGGEEFPDLLGERIDGQWRVKPCYEGLYPHGSTEWVQQALAGSLGSGPLDPDLEARKDGLYATGLERGNSSVGYVALSTLFLREHNRICDVLARAQPGWGDERLFQTARMINTVLLLKFVVDDYINHIAGVPLFQLKPGLAEGKRWYRTNWIALEFDLLYRWHGLVPDALVVNGERVPSSSYRWNNALFEQVGMAAVVSSSSAQAAGRIGLANNPRFLMEAEFQTVKMGRDFRLRSFNDYREQFGLKRLRSFEQLTANPELRQRLCCSVWPHRPAGGGGGPVRRGSVPGGLFGPLMLAMVAYDAFTQIYTNPLLSMNVFSAETFSKAGLELIHSTTTFADLVRRNVPEGSDLLVSLAV